MTAESMPIAVRLVLLVVLAATAGAIVVLAARRSGWPPAGGLVLLAATPLVPHVPVAGGLSLDDAFPVVGLLALLATVDVSRLVAIGTERPIRLAVTGVVLLVAAGIVSSVVNGTDPGSALTMLLRGPGRYLFLAAIVAAVALTEPPDRRMRLVARALAGVGTFEAVFGLAAFLLPLGGIGLEPTRRYSVIYLEVSGRIAGTLGISPNFLGAIFIITILLAVGLALAAATRRERIGWWASVLVQTLALTLTFTRASLAIALLGVLILLLLRGRLRYVVPVALAVVLGFAITPALERLTGDVPDRLALWASSATMMLDHPLAGVGPGRTQIVASADPERYRHTAFGAAVNNAHNNILLAGAESGVVAALGALLVNVGLAWAALARLLDARRAGSTVSAAAAIAVLGYLLQGMVNNLFNVAAAGAVFALVTGAFVVASQRQRAPIGPLPEDIA